MRLFGVIFILQNHMGRPLGKLLTNIEFQFRNFNTSVDPFQGLVPVLVKEYKGEKKKRVL